MKIYKKNPKHFCERAQKTLTSNDKFYTKVLQGFLFDGKECESLCSLFTRN